MLRSIIEYYAEHERYRCGYCKGSDTNYGHGMWAHTMTVSDYQDLIDRGWRRSGKYVYKPTISIICCPSYTIRCKALEFKASKSQKKVLKQFNKYLIGQEEAAGGGDQQMSSGSEDIRLEDYGEGPELFVETSNAHRDINLTSLVAPVESNSISSNDKNPEGEMSEIDTSEDKNALRDSQECKKDPSRVPCKKAKQLRIERKLERLKQKGIDVSTLEKKQNKEKQVEDFINELPKETKRKLKIKLVRTNPPSPEWLETAKETHQVYVKYQTTVHGDKPEKCTQPKFEDFLVQSPLLEEHNESGPACGYGSFHQQYWLDGKIIAVGVIDVLPKCVSSVYFFYDPQYRNLTLGTYGALREIEFTRHLHTCAPELKYYYMGFYIHSCRKMRYKGNFFPSDLLCPETYKWIPIRDCIPILEITPYSRLDPDIDSIDENYPTEDDINYIPMLFKGEVTSYKTYKRKMGKRADNADVLMEYAKLVGAKSAKSLVMFV
ncbi:arginyl-tRNA--protein transferase 1 isoform X2 [Epargyreus clarus]|uniref:arginyl-tRNA--protein transferase 1 isoform X2 n=1 Tax=Epargyreus clarus TaxID=520877 RepID=UPI003C303400